MMIAFRRRHKIAVLFGLVLTLSVVGVALSAAFLVDSFDDAPQTVVVNPVTTTASSTADNAGILGTERDVFMTWMAGTGTSQTVIDAFNSNFMSFEQGSSVKSIGNMTWDGNDNDATSLAHTGLSPTDLTGGGTNDGFHLRVLFTDVQIPITLTVYTDASNWSERTLTIPGGIGAGNVDYLLRFSDFTTGGGTGADFTDVGAIVMEVDGDASAGADLTLEFFQVNDFRDFGDLPGPADSGYSNAVLAASHIPGGLRLGTYVDMEAVAQAGTLANGDDNRESPNDEDGVAPTTGVKWNDTDGGSVDVTVTGCASTCRLSGWIDWNNDFDFTDTDEDIFTDLSVSNGTSTRTFTIPTGTSTSNASFYARFRICTSTTTCNTVTAVDVANGEVEDYQWLFGPTAVTLQELTARTNDGQAVLALALFGVMALMAVTVLRRQGVRR